MPSVVAHRRLPLQYKANLVPNNVGLALGTMAGVFGQHFAQQKQQEHDDEQKRIQLVSGLVSSGLKDGSISNPNEAFQFLLDQVGGKGKGGQKGELPGPLKMMLGATQQAAGQAQGAPGSDQTLGGQQRPSFQPQAPQAAAPHFLTGQERDQQATDSDVNRAKRLSSEVTQPNERFMAGLRGDEKRKEEAAALEREKAKPQRTQMVAGTVSGADVPEGTTDAYGQAVDPKKHYRQTVDGKFVPTEVAAKTDSSPLGRREQELVAQGIPAERARSVAALQLQKERGQKQQDASTRLGAYLATSRANLAMSGERYAEMKALFPLITAAKQAGLEVAELRPEVIRQQLEKGDQALAKGAVPKADVAAQKEAAKVVQQATRTAASMAGKQSSVLTALGINDDEATIRKHLIQELSGGQDPDAVEALARVATTAPTPAAARTPSSTPSTVKTKNGTFTIEPAPAR